MNDKASQLSLFMDDLSEEFYHSRIVDRWEEGLWAVLNGNQSDSLVKLSPNQAATLRLMSTACAGWIIFEDGQYKLVPMEEMVLRY